MSNVHHPSFLGPRVRHAREKLRMSAQQLAAAIGLPSTEAVVDVEAGRRGLESEQLAALAGLWEEEGGLDFFLDPFHVTAEAQFTWYGDLTGIDRVGLEKRVGVWVGLVRWLREETKSTTDPMEVLFVDLTERPGAHLGGLCRVGNLQVALFNRCEMHHKGSKRELPKLFSTATVARMHMAVDRGWLTARKAARTLGLDLNGMAELFEAYGLSDPIRSIPTLPRDEAIAALNASLAAQPA